MFPSDCRHTAQILPFRPLRHMERRLTTLDRIEALRWEACNAAEAGARLVIHRVDGDDADEGGDCAGDYISIYRPNDDWAVWGAARCGDLVSVWRSATGADIGHYRTMREALAAVKSRFSHLQS